MNANKCQIIYSIIYIQRFTVYIPHLIIPFESPFHFIRPIFNAFEKYAQTPMNLVYCMQQVFFLHTTIKQVSRRCVGKSVEQSDDDNSYKIVVFCLAPVRDLLQFARERKKAKYATKQQEQQKYVETTNQHEKQNAKTISRHMMRVGLGKHPAQSD